MLTSPEQPSIGRACQRNCRVEGGDAYPHVASCTIFLRANPWCIVRNAVRVAGMVASFMFRGSMRECLRNPGFVRFAQASKRVMLRGVVTPYKVSVFQKICWQALNVLIPSHTLSACFISSHLLAEHSIRSDSTTKHTAYST